MSNNDTYSEKLRLGIEDLRLWRMKKENTSMLLLEEGEDKTLDMLNIKSGTSLLIEVRTHTHTPASNGCCELENNIELQRLSDYQHDIRQ